MEDLKVFRSWRSFPVIILLLVGGFAVVRGCPMVDPKNILVGGEEGWRFGYNYTEWVSKAGPFYVNDILVFRYTIPTSSSFPHMVVLLKNRLAYEACITASGRLLADPTAGIGRGYRFRLKKPKNYFFACGVGNGTHCEHGFMKFGVRPVLRPPC